jgi:RNA polymerase sigma-70 factor (ECF subfamily)
MALLSRDSIQALPRLRGSAASRASSSRDLELEFEVVGLFDAHRSRLLAYIAAIGVDGHDGEEIVQEVFLALFRHLRLGKSRSNLRGWIFRVAHNLALRQREEHLLAAQRQSRLLSVVSALPEQDRLCFNLRAEGLRYREIAQVLGISLGSVSMSLTRTVARLMRADEGRREPVSEAKR